MSLNGELERLFCEDVKVKLGLPWDPKMLEMPELWVTFQEKLLTMSKNSLSERSVLQSTKLKGVGDLKRTLISDMKIEILEFAQLVFVLIWSSISSLYSLPYILV